MSGKRENGKDRDLPNDDSRRSFLYNALMGTGLVVSHLTALGFIVRYLYPTKNETKQRLFVGLKSEIPPGSAIVYEAPGGKTVNVVRGQRGFVALSDVCPHLGCRVHWDSANDEFLCPCHDGHFDANGIATAGPPLDMGGQLPQYNVSIDGDMVFLEMEVTS